MKCGTGDINTVIDSIVEGAREVTEALGKDLPKGSIVAEIDSIDRASRETYDSGEKAKSALLKKFGLEGEAKDNFGTTNVEFLIKEANDLMRRAQENLKNIKYNPYAPLKEIADTYNEAAANEAIKNLRGELTTRLKDSEGFVGKTIEELVEEKNILSQLEAMPNFTKLALKPELSNSLIRLNLLNASELHKTKGLSAVNFAAKGEEIIGKLQASKSLAQEETKTTLQEFFTAHINQIQDGKTKINLVNLMDKLLFDIQEMKNASRLIKTPTAESNGSKLMGEMFENALNSKSPIQITAPGI